MNNDFYLNYITNIKDKIDIVHKELFNMNTQNILYVDSSISSKHRDDTMQLNNLLWKQKLSEYRDIQKKKNNNINYAPKQFNIIDDEVKLLDLINTNSYKTTWNRLDNYQKKTKIKEFIHNVYEQGKIIEEEYTKMMRSIDIIIKKCSSKKIKYDNISKITSIWCIMYNKEMDIYTFTL